MRRGGAALALALLSACGAVSRCTAPAPLDDAAMAALYADPPPPPQRPLRVYHLGHSLVGRDMPAMLSQLADAAMGPGHRYESQLGWGTTLREHWEPDLPINGFETENAHPRHRDAAEALASGDYDAFVMTEMVEIRDAIRHHDSWDYLRRWAARARAGNPDIRVYLYESWPQLDDPEGWLTRLDADPARYWEGAILRPALAAEARDGAARPIWLIPAGRVMARFARALAARGGVDGLRRPEDLFSDEIHFNDQGAYLTALTHFATLYGRSPVGLPRALLRADGAPAEAPGPQAARLMQEVVWEVVASLPLTGVRRDGPDAGTDADAGSGAGRGASGD